MPTDSSPAAPCCGNRISEPVDLRDTVRRFYAERAVTGASCCSGANDDLERFTALLGYSEEERQAAPEGANLGLGCGNPTAIDRIAEGATVLDLGSGGGFDCFLAARKVGPGGRVIGVDMTPEMIERARRNAREAGLPNVEFRLGEIESLPVADASVDVVISNCVVNLSPDKQRVFAEAFRVLKPGGKLMVSDIVLTGDLPEAVRKDAAAYAACIGGAIRKEIYLGMIEGAGFAKMEAAGVMDYAGALMESGWAPDEGAGFDGPLPVVSLHVSAVKPL